MFLDMLGLLTQASASSLKVINLHVVRESKNVLITYILPRRSHQLRNSLHFRHSHYVEGLVLPVTIYARGDPFILHLIPYILLLILVPQYRYTFLVFPNLATFRS